jgi:WD40 repeat protein
VTSSTPQQMDHPLPGNTVAFSPHRHVLATAAYDESGTVWLWDLSRPTRHAALGVLHTHAVGGTTFPVLAFRPDGRFLATDGTGPGQVRLWDTKNPAHPRPLDATMSISDNTDVNAVAFSPDGHIAAVAGDNGAQLWNIIDPGDPLFLGKSLGHPSYGGISLAESDSWGPVCSRWRLRAAVPGCSSPEHPQSPPASQSVAPAGDRARGGRTQHDGRERAAGIGQQRHYLQEGRQRVFPRTSETRQEPVRQRPVAVTW